MERHRSSWTVASAESFVLRIPRAEPVRSSYTIYDAFYAVVVQFQTDELVAHARRYEDMGCFGVKVKVGRDIADDAQPVTAARSKLHC